MLTLLLRNRTTRAWLAAACAALLASCASQRAGSPDTPMPAERRALIGRLLPPTVADRAGWVGDIDTAFVALEIAPSADNLCAVIAVTEQESSFRADPAVPGLAAIAWKAIDQRAEQSGVPRVVVHTALLLTSPNGQSYSERIDAAKTEKQLSDIFDDFIGIVPMGKTFFADRNPVRTGGPMQVSIAFAQAHAQAKRYPYPVAGTIRHEVFTRRGGMYFGIAHLLDYPAAYDSALYRFADFNAGRYASRNAAFQSAVSLASGMPLALDGDLLRYDDAAKEPGSTELATRALARRLGLGAAEIRRDLEQGTTAQFEHTRLYERVFQLADKLGGGKPVPRAVLPGIALQSPKITRKLTTAWFAQRVAERQQRCLARAEPGGG